MTDNLMKLKDRGIEIPAGDPYKNDLLNRCEFGENLTKIVSKIISPLTISVNGAWGTGKTVFLEMWNQSLKDAGYSTIYFSAWEDDYCDDAMIALVGQIWKNIKDSDWKEMGKTLKEVAVPLMKNIGSQILTNAIRHTTLGVVDLDLDTETLKSNVEKMLDEYATATSDIESIKKRLAECSEECRERTGKPLVIIIDELDRCRPIFAIELLEKIKHFFDIPGVIFVLGIDREQLKHSIRSVYGRIDADGYLRRFIDLEFLLKMNDTEPFFTNIIEKYGVVGDVASSATNPSWAAIVSKCFGLSLREMEYLARTVIVGKIINSTMATRILLPLLVALKLRDEIFYKKIISGQCNATEIIEQLVSEHNAWELFGINPETKQLMRGFGHALCTELYAISPRSWRDDVDMALRKSTDANPQFAEDLFHNVVQKIYYMKQDSVRHFDSDFKLTLNYGIQVNDFSKCIELIEFNDETKRG